MSFLKSRATVLAVLLTAALLPVLAALQYRWLGTLSELEHRRAHSNLHRATERFCDELDRDLTRIYNAFRPNLSDHRAETEEKLAAGFEEWSSSGSSPELVRDVYWITRRHEKLKIQKFDPLRQRLEESERPDWLRSIEDGLLRYDEGRGREHKNELDPLRPEVPALLVFGERVRDSCVAVRLDRDVLLDKVFPERIREYFGSGDEKDYEILIVDAINPDAVVYRSTEGLTHQDFVAPDAEELLFRLRLRSRRSDKGRWRFLIRHRAGSLEAAVAATRLRNLAIAFGGLVLLGASMVLLIVTTRRAHAVARQQVEFVAGVSHELRTPLAGISSLSENLADGVVHDIERTREYGQAIHRETRRLGDMLERVLLFSTIESGKTYEMRPVDLVETIESGIESTRSLITEKAADVIKEIPSDIPPVLGDPGVLKVAIQNILTNALKFSPKGSRIRIRASVTDAKAAREVLVIVEDQGSGIPSSELPHIFEPFYRGSNAKEEQIEGSGLGLSIVKRILEAQGGKVTCKSELGKGTTISIHLPVAGDGKNG